MDLLKKRYRKFNIKSETVKGDDYGMMKEVLKEDFQEHLKMKVQQNLPDLVLIDGGKGQYSVSREILE